MASAREPQAQPTRPRRASAGGQRSGHAATDMLDAAMRSALPRAVRLPLYPHTFVRLHLDAGIRDVESSSLSLSRKHRQRLKGAGRSRLEG